MRSTYHREGEGGYKAHGLWKGLWKAGCGRVCGEAGCGRVCGEAGCGRACGEAGCGKSCGHGLWKGLWKVGCGRRPRTSKGVVTRQTAMTEPSAAPMEI